MTVIILSKAPGRTFAGMQRILIVDPHKDAAEHLMDQLKRLPFEVNHVRYALSPATIASWSPQLIMTRYDTYSGFAVALCRMLKATPALCQIPVILISDSAHVAHIARENQADGFLLEPLNADLLCETISRLMPSSSPE